MKRRLLSIMTALCLVLSVVPVAAAEESGTEPDIPTQLTVAEAEGVEEEQGTDDMTSPLANENISGGIEWAYDSSIKELTISAADNPEEGYDSGEMRAFKNPSTATDVDKAPWWSQKSDIESLVIDNGVISIGDWAFYDMESLTGSVVLPDSLVAVGEHAFRECSSLTSLTIGKNVSDISYRVFEGMESLTSFVIDDENSCFVMEDGILYNTEKTVVIEAIMFEGEYAVPSTVTEIRKQAFMSCDDLTSVDFSAAANLGTIGISAFSDTGMSQDVLVIPETVESIGEAAFYRADITDYVEVRCPDIGKRAFRECSAKTVKLLNRTHSIGEEAFRDMENLEKVEIIDPNSGVDAASIPANAVGMLKNTFLLGSGKTGKLTSIQIPAGITKIGATITSSQPVTSVTFPGGSNLKTIEGSAFKGKEAINTLSIPDSVEYIGENAFMKVGSLTSWSSASNLKEIGAEAFNQSGFHSYDTCVIPENVTTIPAKAFYMCGDLKGPLYISNGVNSVGESAFQVADLSAVYLPESISSIAKLAFVRMGEGTEDQAAVIYCANNNVFELLAAYSTNGNPDGNYSNQTTAVANLNGGSICFDEDYKGGILVADPTKKGYTFDGWYDNADCSGTSVTTAEAGTTYYAKWIEDDSAVEEPDLQPVNLVIYRNGNTAKPYKTVRLANVERGGTYDLSELDIAQYYTGSKDYKFEGFYNDGEWNDYKAGKIAAELGASIIVNGWTNINCIVTDYEHVNVYGTINKDVANKWEIAKDSKVLYGTNLLEYLEELNVDLDKRGYTYDRWFKLDSPKWKFGEGDVVTDWTNVLVNYTPDNQKIVLQIYRNGDRRTPVNTVYLDDGLFGTPVKDILDCIDLDELYTPDKNALGGYEWDGVFYNDGWYDISDSTINGWTNLKVMVYDKYSVRYHVDGNVIDTEYVTSNVLPHTLKDAPAKRGYAFDGWYQSEKDLADGKNKIAEIDGLKKWELYGKYDAIPQSIHLQVYRNGKSESDKFADIALPKAPFDSPISDITQNINTLDSYYTCPKDAAGYDWDGQFFVDGWYPVGDRTVNGWTNLKVVVYDKYAINYHVYGLDIPGETFTVRDLETYELYSVPDKQGFIFDGWYQKADDIGNANKRFRLPLALKKYELYGRYDASLFTVTFLNSADDTYKCELSNLAFGYKIVPPELNDPYGRALLGWYSAEDGYYDFSNGVEKNMTLVAYWADAVIGCSAVDATGDGITNVVDPVVGQTLNANIMTTSGPIYSYPRNEAASYTWHYADSDSVLGTEPTYTVTSDNLGKILVCDVAVENYMGAARWTGTVDVKCEHEHFTLTGTDVATCVVDGADHYKCDDCGYSWDVTIAKIDHIEYTDPAQEPTCVEYGWTAGSHCTRCGGILVQQTVLAPLGHDMGEWTTVKEATQTEMGEEQRNCSRCDYRETRATAAIPVTYRVVTFLDGTVTLSEVSVLDGQKVSRPSDPNRSGYTFDGWYLGEAKYDFDTPVNSDITLTARWRRNSSGGGSSGGSSYKDKTHLNTNDHYSYIVGDKDGFVNPYGEITRGEVASIFFRLLTDDARAEYWKTENDYTDIPSGLWCNNAVSTLSNMGIIDGYQDGSFQPYGKITRAQFAKIAVGFFETAEKEYRGTFEDVPEDVWYASYVEAAARVGLVSGFEDGTFHPEENITRAQACVIVNRALDRKPHEDHLLPKSKMILWPDIDEDDWFYADMMEATNSHDYTLIYETVNGERTKVEEWTKKLPQRDWAAFEAVGATAHSAPGGEVVED